MNHYIHNGRLLKWCWLEIIPLRRYFKKKILFSNSSFTGSCKNSTERSHVPVTQLPSMIASYVVIVQYQNQEVDINTILLTWIQTIFTFRQFVFYMRSFVYERERERKSKWEKKKYFLTKVLINFYNVCNLSL